MAQYHLTISYSFKFNCGFARCAIHELTPKGRNSATDKPRRMTEFHDLFKDCPNYGLSSTYFENTSKCRESTFDRHCETIIQSWRKKWHPPEKRSLYETTFSIENWKALYTFGQEIKAYPLLLPGMLQPTRRFTNVFPTKATLHGQAYCVRKCREAREARQEGRDA